ncbi:DUF531 family protein [Methanosarcina barkeri]|uniref:DUF531 family protein n=1 Tax=Methanosarcina barkeri TaxID=2208 RepID=UPI000B13EB90|nr:DUF531 family protein [Methanosarcina barkeri]
MTKHYFTKKNNEAPYAHPRIVNTYDKIKVLDAHYRAIARAAPICHAFGFHLALYDFPFKMTAEELVAYVMEKNHNRRIGKLSQNPL